MALRCIRGTMPSPRAMLVASLRRRPPPPTSRASFARLGPRHSLRSREEGSALSVTATIPLLNPPSTWREGAERSLEKTARKTSSNAAPPTSLSAPLPPRSGGEGSGVGGFRAQCWQRARRALRPRRRLRKHHFDQRTRMRGGLDVELRAVGFDQRLGQGKADAGTVGGLVRRRMGAERLHGGGDLVVVEPVAGIAHP